MRGRSAENTFSKWLGKSEPLKIFWVRAVDDLEQLSLGEGQECDEIWDFVPFRKEKIKEVIHQSVGRTAYLGRYITLRRVTKSAAVSKDRIRGQPLDESAVSRLV